jgi:hypothetical protein
VSAVADETLLYANPRDRTLQIWKRRRDTAAKHRRQFEGQWMQSQAFASGKQWVEYRPRVHRVLTAPLPEGRTRQTSDVLSRYVWTVIGELAAADFRPQFLFSREQDDVAQDVSDLVNDAMAFGWDHEWRGDQRVHELLLKLAVYGTAAIRCRFDKTKGPIIGRDVLHVDDRPILDRDQELHHRAEAFATGRPVDSRVLREGRVVWETIGPFGLLPPPGVEYPDEFPWEIIVRPVGLDELRRTYGSAAAGLKAARMEALDGVRAAGDDERGRQAALLEDQTLLYTGYKRPDSEHPDGQTVVFTEQRLLDDVPSLPYPDSGARPASTGITYFSYWPVAGRFWGRAFVEPGIGPQRIRNKRLTQNDEIIDRSLPKVYVRRGSKVKAPTGLPLEVIEVDQEDAPTMDRGAGPGEWMWKDIAQQDTDLEKTLGVNPVTLGQQPSGTPTYSALTLLKEQDRKKIGPVEDRLALGLIDVACDSLEAMRNWPQRKLLMIEGENEKLKVLEFTGSQIPTLYLAAPAKGEAGPHSPAAELAKVNEVWAARLALGPPNFRWLTWYVESLTAGKMLDIPDDDQAATEHVHKAALENVAMSHTGQPVPVAPYDNHELHVAEHVEEQVQQGTLAAAGDPAADQAVQAIELHKQMHLQAVQQQAAVAGPAPPPALPAAGPPATVPV